MAAATGGDPNHGETMVACVGLEDLFDLPGPECSQRIRGGSPDDRYAPSIVTRVGQGQEQLTCTGSSLLPKGRHQSCLGQRRSYGEAPPNHSSTAFPSNFRARIPADAAYPREPGKAFRVSPRRMRHGHRSFRLEFSVGDWGRPRRDGQPTPSLREIDTLQVLCANGAANLAVSASHVHRISPESSS